MKVHIENLGILKQAKFELGSLTIICGENNTGKTYAAYALFGFLLTYDEHLNINIPTPQIKELADTGSVNIDIASYADRAHQILADACRRYTKALPNIFSSKDANFKDTKFSITLSPEEINCYMAEEVQYEVKAGEDQVISLNKERGSTTLKISSFSDMANTYQIRESLAKHVISTSIRRLLFGSCLPRPHIAGSERTGVAIFRKQLNSSHSRLLGWLSKAERDVDLASLLQESYSGYTLPELSNIDLARQLDYVSKRDSFLAKEHDAVLDNLTDIIGGEYVVGNHDIIYFKPSNETKMFTMTESSSTVRSLLDIDFYLRHLAEKGDILMIDMPELGLHPENQCKMARLLARLVNVGVKVFVTTHSDYIVKELNTLIFLSEGTPRMKRIASEEGYHDEEIIRSEKINTYIAEKAFIKRNGGQKRVEIDTLVQANVDQEYGIQLSSFDKTIDRMNQLQDEIIWGED